MSTTDWIIVAAAVVGGFVIGGLLSRLAYGMMASPTRPRPLQEAARPLSSLAFWVAVIVGLMALETIPRDLVGFLPQVLSAAIIVIGANVLSSFVLTAIGGMLARASASVQRQVSMLVKTLIIGMAALLAVAQLGVDTTVINLAVAAIFFGVAASLTLLIGLGGRGVATEVASTRVLRRLLQIGDTVTVGDISGRVVAVHPTAVEVTGSDGKTLLVPSSSFTSKTITVDRATAGRDDTEG
jgi:hypothetical protein